MLKIWMFQLLYGIIYAIAGKEIHPAIYICAVLVCIIHYVSEIIKESM